MTAAAVVTLEIVSAAWSFRLELPAVFLGHVMNCRALGCIKKRRKKETRRRTVNTSVGVKKETNKKKQKYPTKRECFAIILGLQTSEYACVCLQDSVAYLWMCVCVCDCQCHRNFPVTVTATNCGQHTHAHIQSAASGWISLHASFI